MASEFARSSVKKDLDKIWSKYHINNLSDDGYNDDESEVIKKFSSALKEQIDYFNQ